MFEADLYKKDTEMGFETPEKKVDIMLFQFAFLSKMVHTMNYFSIQQSISILCPSSECVVKILLFTLYFIAIQSLKTIVKSLVIFKDIDQYKMILTRKNCNYVDNRHFCNLY